MPGLPDFRLFSQKVEELGVLAAHLPESVPLGSKDDKILQVFDNIPVPSDASKHWEAFNKRMDALFGHDQRGEDGRLLYVRRGELGMDLVVKYFNSAINAGNLPWDLALIKVDRLVEELKVLGCVLALFPFIAMSNLGFWQCIFEEEVEERP